MRELTRDECFEVFKKYDPKAYEYYSQNAWFFGCDARNYASRLLREKEGETMKPLDEYSFREFKQLILCAAKSADLWYFSQTKDGYYADYRPDYPNKTAADFTVYLCNGSDKPRLTIYQETATIPTIKQYSDMKDLLMDIQNMGKGG